jgi:hypothetical protein
MLIGKQHCLKVNHLKIFRLFKLQTHLTLTWHLTAVKQENEMKDNQISNSQRCLIDLQTVGSVHL